MVNWKERILIVLIILLFSFWYVFTGYLLLDYFAVGCFVYLLAAMVLVVIIMAVLQTVKSMKNGDC